MVQTAYGKIKTRGRTYLYVVKMTGTERIYRRVNSAPCRTNVNCDEKLLNLLTSNKAVFDAFISGIDIVLRSKN